MIFKAPIKSSLTLLLAVMLSGCATTLARPNWSAAQQAVIAQLGTVRSMELLQEVAAEQQERRHLARLDSIFADFSSAPERFTIFTDPVLAELDFATLYAQVVLLPSRTELSQALHPIAQRYLSRQLGLLWCQMPQANRSDREILATEIGLLTGWPEEQIRHFDFATLPQYPEAAPRPVVGVSLNEIRELIRQLYCQPTPAAVGTAQKYRLNYLLCRYGRATAPATRQALALQLEFQANKNRAK